MSLTILYLKWFKSNEGMRDALLDYWQFGENAQCMFSYFQNSSCHLVNTTLGTWSYHISNVATISPLYVHVFNYIVPQMVQKLWRYEWGLTWLLAIREECTMCYLLFSKLHLPFRQYHIRYIIISYIKLSAHFSFKCTCL